MNSLFLFSCLVFNIMVMLSVSQTTVDEDVGTVTINAVGTLAPPATLPGDVPVTGGEEVTANPSACSHWL